MHIYFKYDTILDICYFEKGKKSIIKKQIRLYVESKWLYIFDKGVTVVKLILEYPKPFAQIVTQVASKKDCYSHKIKESSNDRKNFIEIF